MKRHVYMAIGLVLTIVVVPSAWAGEVTIEPSKDNTLYEDPTAMQSNGQGDYFFAGRTLQGADYDQRRALVAFDILAAIPAGSTINSATLTLYMSRSIAGDSPVALHRVLSDWGAAGSDASGQEGVGDDPGLGDATWQHTFFPDSFWDSFGGDFVETFSASSIVGFEGAYAWSSPAMGTDVQSWVDNPELNFGWILIGDEETSPSAKRFDSRENTVATQRPKLTIDFDPPCPEDIDGNGAVEFADLLRVLASWGLCP